MESKEPEMSDKPGNENEAIEIDPAAKLREELKRTGDPRSLEEVLIQGSKARNETLLAEALSRSDGPEVARLRNLIGEQQGTLNRLRKLREKAEQIVRSSRLMQKFVGKREDVRTALAAALAEENTYHRKQKLLSVYANIVQISKKEYDFLAGSSCERLINEIEHMNPNDVPWESVRGAL